MIYRLYTPIRGLLSEDSMEAKAPTLLPEEALPAYQKEIQGRIQYVTKDGAVAKRMKPFVESERLSQALANLQIDAVVDKGKLMACIQVTVAGALEDWEESDLESYMQEQFRHGIGEMFPPARVPEGWVRFQLETPECCAFFSQKKYEITDIRHPKYPWLHRIRALCPINNMVSAGDAGGFVESEDNLSQAGECWIYDDAICCEGAFVDENARLFDGTLARDSALITGDSAMFDRAVAEGYCCIRSGEIKDDVKVGGNAVIDNYSDSKSPVVGGQCNIYGTVLGWFVVEDNVFAGENFVNPSQDLLILKDGRKEVVRANRKLQPPKQEEMKKSIKSKDEECR